MTAPRKVHRRRKMRANGRKFYIAACGAFGFGNTLTRWRGMVTCERCRRLERR